jgi:hypothetical protein
LASKYIDEETTANRAKMLEELRHGRMVKDDQYQNSPWRQAQQNQNATNATMAQGAAADAVSLARLNNTELWDAQQTSEDRKAAAETARKVSEIEAMTEPQIKAANARVGGTMGIEVQREGLIADARARMAAKYRPSAGGGSGDGGGLKLPPGVKAELDSLEKRGEQINAAVVRAQAEGSWNPDKNPSQKQLLATQRATQRMRAQLIAPYLPRVPDLLNLFDSPQDAPVVERTPPAAPTGPGFWDRTMKAAGEVGASGRSAVIGAMSAVHESGAAMREVGSQYEAIDKRWREAGRGGPPLTDAERVQARAFGLAVR